MSYLPRKLNIARWLLPLFVMLVVLEIASFPYVLSTIYSEKFVSPDRRLAYVGGRIESGDGFIYNGAGKVRLASTTGKMDFSREISLVSRPYAASNGGWF